MQFLIFINLLLQQKNHGLLKLNYENWKHVKENEILLSFENFKKKMLGCWSSLKFIIPKGIKIYLEQ